MSANACAAGGNFWTAGEARFEPAPPLAGDSTADVAVIGAGYTGLATAYHLKCLDPSLDVAIVEAEACGFGASGRNAGFVMTLFGSSLAAMRKSHGDACVRAAHHYMEGAIDALADTIAANKLACDFERSGFLKVATTPTYEARIRKEVEAFDALGITGLQWLPADEVAARVRSPAFLGALYEPGCGLINPVKWVEALRGLAIAKGARLYEGTRVASVTRDAGLFRLATPGGTLTADKVVFATNGYTHLMPGLRSKQLPAFAYIVVTEPLRESQRAAIGWAGREGIEDGRNFMHFFRLTPDNRILVGGGPGYIPFGSGMHHDASPKAWEHLEHFIGETFPALADIRITHRWGGAFSATSDSTPQIGTVFGGGAFYSVGCTGHGVAMTHQNGRILADLVLGRSTELTDLWFVNRRSFPLPPEPFRWIGTRAVTTAMKIDDWWCDRGAAAKELA